MLHTHTHTSHTVGAPSTEHCMLRSVVCVDRLTFRIEDFNDTVKRNLHTTRRVVKPVTKLTVLIQCLPYCYLVVAWTDKAVVEVSQRAILVLRLFDWDRTSDDESLGRLGKPINRNHTNFRNLNRNSKQKHIYKKIPFHFGTWRAPLPKYNLVLQFLASYPLNTLNKSYVWVPLLYRIVFLMYFFPQSAEHPLIYLV